MRRGKRWLAIVSAAMMSVGVVGASRLAADEPPETPQAQGHMDAEDFLRSPFGQLFRSGNYAGALKALESLQHQYPDDLLLTRYHAVTLDRLGRYQEALAVYQQLLSRDPNHVPSHFFLGQTYSHMGDTNAATKEWQWVVEQSPVEQYRQWAQERLDHMREETVATAVATAVRRRPYLVGDAGLEYDSNPLLKPNDKGVAAQGNEKQAERFSVNATLGYPLWLKSDARVDLLYTTRQTLHTRDLDEVNFTGQELALAATKRGSLANHDVIWGARYDFLSGWLDGQLFSVTNQWLFSADTRLTPHTRTIAYHRFAVANYGPDGSNPPQTSRDGFNYDLGLTQYLYTDDFRRYLFLTQELNVADARGGNFTRRGTSTRLGVHTPVPVVPQTDFDLSGGFVFGTYPDFSPLSSLDVTRREDTNWDLYTSLTYYWTPHIGTRAFYRYVNANNRNDIFQYDRQIGGVQVVYSYSF